MTLRQAFDKTVQRFSMRRVANGVYSKGRIRLIFLINSDCLPNHKVSILYNGKQIAEVTQGDIQYWDDKAYDYVMAMREYLTK